MNIVLEATVADIGSLVIGSLGLVGLLFAYLQLRYSRRANEKAAAAARAGFVLEIHKWMRDNQGRADFFYRLDYESREFSFVFDPEKFPGSEDEYHLDSIIYKLVFVGGLVRRGVLELEDVSWMLFVVRTVLTNKQVLAYLTWLQSSDQVPGHSEFVDAIHLLKSMLPSDEKLSPQLVRYVQNAKTP